MSKYIDAEKLLEKEKALLKRLMAFRNALAEEEAKCADARIKLLEKVIDDIANAPAVSVSEDEAN
jgi:pantothenate kinase